MIGGTTGGGSRSIGASSAPLGPDARQPGVAVDVERPLAPVAALEDAWAACDLDREWSDEAAMLEAAGLNVHAVVARHPNPKITTTADLEMVRLLGGAGS